jgi:hypothetical protein
MCREKIHLEAERPPLFFIERESAVSPVVGVMLMLVVTIIVAALVSSFSGGLSDSAKPAPITAFDISIRAGDDVGNGAISPAPGTAPECPVLRMVSGDTLSSADLQIILTYTVPETYNGIPLRNAGKVIKHTLDGAIGQVDVWDENSDPFVPQVNGYCLSRSNLNSLAPGNGMMGIGTPHFGECLFKPGEAYWFKDRNAFLGFDATDRMKYGFQEGSVVHVTIIHMPSGQTVYDQDVVVQW